jgi:cytochrome P450
MTILSTKSATDFFKNHDLSFADRYITETMRPHSYDQCSLALAPYGTHWRVVRKIMTVDMLVNKRINETVMIRSKCADNMLLWVEEEAKKLKGRGVHVARFVFLATFNVLGNLMLSRDLIDPNSKDGVEFFEAMMKLMHWSGIPNSANYFPWLRKLDPQGLRKKMSRDLGKALEIASKFVEVRMNEKVEEVKKKDLLDVLLEFEGKEVDEKLSLKEINVLILELFMAGTETTSSAIEWALTELLLNPKTMENAKVELAQVVGPNKKFSENDIDNTPYLQAVIKETLRLHPPIPFLIPRKSTQDTTFMNYQIPKNTQVLVNAWAIGRDPDVWTDPWSFKPERFVTENSNVDYKGLNYELIPFGAGRRMCAGIPLAHRMLHLLLGNLVYEFDWEFDRSISRENIDMKDKLGITMRKAEPLLAVPKRCV